MMKSGRSGSAKVSLDKRLELFKFYEDLPPQARMKNRNVPPQTREGNSISHPRIGKDGAPFLSYGKDRWFNCLI